MNEKDKLTDLFDFFLNDECPCCSCELRMLIIDAIEELLIEE